MNTGQLRRSSRLQAQAQAQAQALENTPPASRRRLSRIQTPQGTPPTPISSELTVAARDGQNVNTHLDERSMEGTVVPLPDVCKKFTNYLSNGAVLATWGLGSVAAVCAYPLTVIPTIFIGYKVMSAARQGTFNIVSEKKTTTLEERSIELNFADGRTLYYEASPSN